MEESLESKCKDHLQATKEELQKDVQEMIEVGVLVDGVGVIVLQSEFLAILNVCYCQ